MNKIRALREERQMTQSELGKLLNVKDAAVSKYESGKVPLTADTIIKLANIFDVSTDYILGISGTHHTSSRFTSPNSDDIHLRLQYLLSEDPILDVSFYATVSKIPKDILCKYVSGDESPTAYDLCKLAEAFDTTADYLFGKSDIPHPIKSNIINHTILGERLERELDGKLLVAEIAEKLDVSISTIKKILSGESAPTPDILYRISQLLDKSTDYLLGISNISRDKDELGEYPFRFDVAVSNRITSSMDEYEESNEVWSTILSVSEEEVYLLKNYGFLVHLSVLLKISETLHVSLDYLLNKTDCREVLNKNQEPIVNAYNKLNADNQSIALGELLKLKKGQDRDEYMHSSVAAEEVIRRTGTDNMGK